MNVSGIAKINNSSTLNDRLTFSGTTIINESLGIGTTAQKYKLDVYNSNVSIRAASETVSSILYLATPFNDTSGLKCAIISEGISSWSRSNLHFVLKIRELMPKRCN